jgi:signal transduction histidine kinase
LLSTEIVAFLDLITFFSVPQNSLSLAPSFASLSDHAPGLEGVDDHPGWPSQLWLARLGRLLLVCQVLLPLLWLIRLLVLAGEIRRAQWLALSGALLIVWNLYFLTQALDRIVPAWPPRGGMPLRRKILILGGQVALALVCQSLSRIAPPEAAKQYFWMAQPVFLMLLSQRKRIMLSGAFLCIAAATVCEAYLNGLYAAAVWAFAHSFVSIFICLSLLAAFYCRNLAQHTATISNELSLANQRLEQQAHQSVNLAVLEERNRMARDVHDSLGHSLTVVNAQLEAASALLQAAPGRALQAIEKAQQTSRNGLDEIRRTLKAMRSGSLENRTFPEAFHALVATYERPGLDITFEQHGELPPGADRMEETLFRCAQEGLTNAVRHAGAARIAVALDCSPDSIGLSVTDDGCGFAPGSVPGHGLKGLQERALPLHGKLHYGPAPGGGAICEITLPI